MSRGNLIFYSSIRCIAASVFISVVVCVVISVVICVVHKKVYIAQVTRQKKHLMLYKVSKQKTVFVNVSTLHMHIAQVKSILADYSWVLKMMK